MVFSISTIFSSENTRPKRERKREKETSHWRGRGLGKLQKALLTDLQTTQLYCATHKNILGKEEKIGFFRFFFQNRKKKTNSGGSSFGQYSLRPPPPPPAKLTPRIRCRWRVFCPSHRRDVVPSASRRPDWPLK
jgi:hypothetical protein